MAMGRAGRALAMALVLLVIASIALSLSARPAQAYLVWSDEKEKLRGDPDQNYPGDRGGKCVVGGYYNWEYPLPLSLRSVVVRPQGDYGMVIYPDTGRENNENDENNQLIDTHTFATSFAIGGKAITRIGDARLDWEHPIYGDDLVYMWRGWLKWRYCYSADAYENENGWGVNVVTALYAESTASPSLFCIGVAWFTFNYDWTPKVEGHYIWDGDTYYGEPEECYPSVSGVTYYNDDGYGYRGDMVIAFVGDKDVDGDQSEEEVLVVGHIWKSGDDAYFNTWDTYLLEDDASGNRATVYVERIHRPGDGYYYIVFLSTTVWNDQDGNWIKWFIYNNNGDEIASGSFDVNDAWWASEMSFVWDEVNDRGWLAHWDSDGKIHFRRLEFDGSSASWELVSSDLLGEYVESLSMCLQRARPGYSRVFLATDVGAFLVVDDGTNVYVGGTVAGDKIYNHSISCPRVAVSPYSDDANLNNVVVVWDEGNLTDINGDASEDDSTWEWVYEIYGMVFIRERFERTANDQVTCWSSYYLTIFKPLRDALTMLHRVWISITKVLDVAGEASGFVRYVSRAMDAVAISSFASGFVRYASRALTAFANAFSSSYTRHVAGTITASVEGLASGFVRYVSRAMDAIAVSAYAPVSGFTRYVSRAVAVMASGVPSSFTRYVLRNFAASVSGVASGFVRYVSRAMSTVASGAASGFARYVSRTMAITTSGLSSAFSRYVSRGFAASVSASASGFARYVARALAAAASGLSSSFVRYASRNLAVSTVASASGFTRYVLRAMSTLSLIHI